MAKANPRPTAGAPRDTSAEPSSETVLLASYRAAIEAGDQAETDRLAAKLLFPAAAVRLHRTILEEAAELKPLADQADQAKEAVVAAERELRLLGSVRIQDLEQLREVGRVRADLESKIRAARLAMNESAAARVALDNLQAWAAPLFGRPESRFGCLMEGSRTAALVDELDVSDWRGPRIAAGGLAKPRRRIVSM